MKASDDIRCPHQAQRDELARMLRALLPHLPVQAQDQVRLALENVALRDSHEFPNGIVFDITAIPGGPPGKQRVMVTHSILRDDFPLEAAAPMLMNSLSRLWCEATGRTQEELLAMLTAADESHVASTRPDKPKTALH